MALKTETALLPAALLNKESWHDLVEESIAAIQATEPFEPVSVIFVDGNNQKSINDDLGHKRGDMAIDIIHETLLSTVRHAENPDLPDRPLDVVGIDHDSSHTAGRIGGDEFAIFVRGGQEAAEKLIERMRSKFQAMLALDENADLVEAGAGLSIGAATLEIGMSASELMERADDDMYRDKLAQIPELGETERLFLMAGIKAIRLSGVRLRDLPKYEQKYFKQPEA